MHATILQISERTEPFEDCEALRAEHHASGRAQTDQALIGEMQGRWLLCVFLGWKESWYHRGGPTVN